MLTVSLVAIVAVDAVRVLEILVAELVLQVRSFVIAYADIIVVP